MTDLGGLMLGIIFLSIVFLLIGGGMGIFAVKKTRKLLLFALWFIFGLSTALTSFLSLAVNEKFLFLIFINICICTILLIRTFEIYNLTEGFLCTLVSMCIGVLIMVPILICNMCIDIPEHEIYIQYKIEFNEKSYSVEYYSEDLPVEVNTYIFDKVMKSMKEVGRNSQEGVIKITYACKYPLYLDHERNCTCTTEKICSTCEEYTKLLSVESY